MEPTSANGPQSAYTHTVDQYVEDHYGKVMPPYQRDLVKRLILRDEPITARPYILRHCQNIAREVIAVIAAGQT